VHEEHTSAMSERQAPDSLSPWSQRPTGRPIERAEAPNT